MTRRIATIGIFSHIFYWRGRFLRTARCRTRVAEHSGETHIAHIKGRALACKTQPSSLRALKKKVRRRMVPVVGIELTTYRLQGGCSTTELNRRNIILLDDL